MSFVDSCELIDSGRIDEINQLKYQLENAHSLNEEYLKQIQKQNELIESENAEHQIQIFRMQSAQYEKEVELNALKSKYQSYMSQCDILPEVCDMLGCSNAVEITQKISELKNEIMNLHISVSTAEVFGNSKCPKCMEYENVISSIRSEYNEQLTKVRENYESQITSYKVSMKQSMQRIQELEEQVNGRDDEQKKYEHEMQSVQEELEELKKKYDEMNVANFRYKQEKISMENIIRTKELEMQENQKNDLEIRAKEERYQNTFNQLIFAMNQFRSQYPNFGVPVCNSLNHIFEELLLNESNQIPNMDYFFESLKTVPSQSFDEETTKRLFGFCDDFNQHLFEAVEEQILNLEARVLQINEKIKYCASFFSDKIIDLEEQIADFQENDMAPRVVALQKKLEELSSKPRIVSRF